MSAYLPETVQVVIEEFEKLPGIGPKSAARMAYHYLRSPNNDATKLAEALHKMETEIVYCKSCFNVADKEECDICSSPVRDNSKVCVVEEPLDVVAFEKSGIFKGLYFVLGGVISPAEGIEPDELRFDDLKRRILQLLDSGNSTGVEVISAMNPSLEGEATTSFIIDVLSNEIKSDQVKVSRLAMGLPTGADLEYADRLTLKRALEGRSTV